MVKYMFTKQMDRMDCGAACLSMILKYYKSDIPIHRLRMMSGTDVSGTSLFGLEECMKKLNFDCDCFKSDSSIWDGKKINYPLIAHILKKNGDMHYVVVYGLKKDKLIIADPAEKIKKVTIDDFEKEWTGLFLLMKPNTEYIPIKDKTPTLLSLFSHFKNNKILLLSIIVLTVITTITSIISSYYIQEISDHIIPNQEISVLNIISVGMITILIFNSVFMYLRNTFLIVFGQNTSKKMMLNYMHHLLELPLNFFDTRRSGEIISRFQDARKIVDALSNSIMVIFLDVVMVASFGVILAKQNIILFFISVLTIPFYGIIIVLFMKLYSQAEESHMSSNAEVNSYMIEGIKGIETLKSFNLEVDFFEKFKEKFLLLIKNSFKASNLDLLQRMLKSIVEVVSSTLVLWIGSYLVIERKISFGQLLTFNILLNLFSQSIKNIIDMQVQIQSAQVANNRLNDVLLIPEEENGLIDIRKFLSKASECDNFIKVENLSYSYSMKNDILNDISFSIKKNTKVAIIGKSGSGKSTLAKLLVGFYVPTKGCIKFNNENIRNIEKRSIRDSIIYIPQNSFFFKGSIKENLIFGLNEAVPDEQLIKICEIVKILDFIKSSGLLFEYQIEEDASNLSGGQKQRLALARALLRKPKVLILDEATNGLDLSTEKQITESLFSCSDTTIIFINHRLGTIQNCHQVIILKQGTLVENSKNFSIDLIEKLI